MPPKHLIFGEIPKIFVSGVGRYISKFFDFSNFFKLFHTNAAQITHNCKFGLKSGLDWVKTAKFGHFARFSIFSPKMRLRLTQNGQFHLIHTFFHLLPPKHLIFGEMSKFSFLGGGYISKCFELSNFFKSFHTNAAENDSQFHLIHNCSDLLPPKHLIFGEISKIFISRGAGYIGKFFGFSNFFKSFHTNAAENDPQWQIWPKKWLRLGQNGQFCMFFYLFPQNEAEIDSEWSISPPFGVIATLGCLLVPMYQEIAISKALTPSIENWTMSLE